MSTIVKDPQEARKALLAYRLGDTQEARKALSALLREYESMARSAMAGHALPPAPVGDRLDGREEAVARLALDRASGTVSLVNSVGLLMRLLRILHTLAIPHTDLAMFVGLLRHCGVLPKEQSHSLEEQEKLHKCAFIARAFGLDLGYEWHLHEYGAFSSFLAADHVELVDGKMKVDIGEIVDLMAAPELAELVELVEEAQGSVPLPTAGFEVDRFISLVSGKDRAWLSVASAVVHEKGSCPDDSLPARVARITADCDEKTARRVMADLESSRPPAWGAPPAEAGRGD